MILARGDNGDTQLLILGLSHENVARLLKRMPIHVRRVSHGDAVPEGWEIIICVGETEESLAKEMRECGVVTEATSIIPDRRLGKDSEH